MAAETYRVVLTGALAEGADPQQVFSALSAIFKQPPEQVAKAVLGRRLPINQEFDQEKAERVRQRILAAGAICIVEPVNAAPPLTLELEPREEPPQSAPEPPPAASGGLGLAPAQSRAQAEVIPAQSVQGGLVCPKCGNRQAAGEQCERCGVIFAKLRQNNGEAAAPAAAGGRTRRSGSANPELDYGEFAGPNAEKYGYKFGFFRAAGGSYAFTWHWPCLFVPFYWALYRKMWGWAAVMLLSSFIPFAGLIWPPTANYLYFRHAKSRIDAIRAQNLDEETALERIREAGGVSGKAVVLGIVLTVGASFLYMNYVTRMVMKDIAEMPTSADQVEAEGDSSVLRTHQGRQAQLQMGGYASLIKMWHVGSRSWDLERFRADTELKDEDVEDPWGTPIRFDQRAEGFVLRSAGPDLRFETSDDLTLDSRRQASVER